MLEGALREMGYSEADISAVLNAIPQDLADEITKVAHQSSVSIRELMEALLCVYVAQNIRSEGVLLQDCPRQEHLLRQLELIETDVWQSHRVRKTTSVGAEIAKLLVKGKIRATFDEIVRKAHPIALLILCKVASVSWVPRLRDPTDGTRTHFLHEEYKANGPFVDRLHLRNKAVFDKYAELVKVLRRHGLAVSAHNYAGREGDVRKEHYIFPKELSDVLLGLLREHPEVSKLEEELNELGKAFQLKLKALEFLERYDAAQYKGLGEYAECEKDILSYLKELKPSLTLLGEMPNLLRARKPYIIIDRDLYSSTLRDLKERTIREIENSITAIMNRAETVEELIKASPKPSEGTGVPKEEKKEDLDIMPIVRGRGEKMRKGKGFSKGELDEADIKIKDVNYLGISYDKRRKSMHQENIEKLKSLRRANKNANGSY